MCPQASTKAPHYTPTPNPNITAIAGGGRVPSAAGNTSLTPHSTQQGTLIFLTGKRKL